MIFVLTPVRNLCFAGGLNKADTNSDLISLEMLQTFTRIEYGQERYYLLVDLFQHGENGFDLTICNGKQIWRESGKPFDFTMHATKIAVDTDLQERVVLSLHLTYSM